MSNLVSNPSWQQQKQQQASKKDSERNVKAKGLHPEAEPFHPKRQKTKDLIGTEGEERDAYLDFYDLEPMEIAGVTDHEEGKTPQEEQEYAMTDSEDESLKFTATDEETQEEESEEDESQTKEEEMKPAEIAAKTKFKKAADIGYGQMEAKELGEEKGEEREEYASIWNINLTSMEQHGVS